MAGQIILTGWSDEKFIIRNNDFVRDGYLFLCWNTKADGTGTNIYPNTEVDFQRDTTLYAQWKLIYQYMNLTRLGSVSVNSNIANCNTMFSGLSTPIVINMNRNNSYEVKLKLITGNDVNTKQVIIRFSTSYKFGVCLHNGKLLYDTLNIYSSDSYAKNTTYYLKFVFNGGNEFKVLKSFDNENFSLSLVVNYNFNIVNEQLVFGHGYSHKYTTRLALTHKELKYKTAAYSTTELRWHTNRGCTYADKNGRTYSYEKKLKHATNPKKKTKNSCGYWADEVINHPATGPYYVDVVTYHDVQQVENVCLFLGKIDFNESILIQKGSTFKLRA